jgi:glycosyltransferase involved in cell wall biosynthesis
LSFTVPEAQQGVRIGIDGSNLRAGGGVTHLAELLRAADPPAQGIGRVTLWGGTALLDRIQPAPWLDLVRQPALDRPLPERIWWQSRTLGELAARSCDLLFSPGGSYGGRFRPFVTMSRNLLPFQSRERQRYGWRSWMNTKLLLLRGVQVRTMQNAAGVIFPTDYTRRAVLDVVPTLRSAMRVIPYGIDGRFFCAPRRQEPIETYDVDRPFRLLYVSTVDVYKHQWHVAEAVVGLWRRGLPVALDLVGQAYRPALARLRETCNRIDPTGQVIRYLGPASYRDLPGRYRAADGFVFASTCESMSNILLEAMASGLPIACGAKGLMPELLGDDGVYFDPEQPETIERALIRLVASPERRTRFAQHAYARAEQFSWKDCAADTFGFMRTVYDRVSAPASAPAATA